jgi:hypothetical protein
MATKHIVRRQLSERDKARQQAAGKSVVEQLPRAGWTS